MSRRSLTKRLAAGSQPMQFRLRTLMIFLTIAPPLIAVAWEHRELRHRSVHSFIGIGCIVLYVTAVILQGIVLSQCRDWRPPEDTRMTWISFAVAMLVPIFCFLYVATENM
jgi:hypothetical protein